MNTPSYRMWAGCELAQNAVENQLSAGRSFVTPETYAGEFFCFAHCNKHELPSNGEDFRLICDFTVPEGFIANAKAELDVEDWGEVTAGGTQIVNLLNNGKNTGNRGGHAEWKDSGSTTLAAGERNMTAIATNIDMGEANAQYNQYIFNTVMYAVPLEEGGDNTNEKVNPCGCSGDTCSMEGGAGATGTAPNTSSAGTSIHATTTEEKMYWSCNAGSVRGKGTPLPGKVELVAAELSADLAAPAALAFNHPLNAHLVLPEGGLVPGARFEMVNGSRVIAFRCYQKLSADRNDGVLWDYTDPAHPHEVQSIRQQSGGLSSEFITDENAPLGFIAPVGVDTYGRGRCSSTGTGENLQFIWCNEKGQKWTFSGVTGELISYASTSDDVSVEVANVADVFRVVHNEDGSLRQIWSHWDGLLNIEDVTATGYTIALYTPAQVSGPSEDGTFTRKNAEIHPFKHITVAFVDGALRITQHKPGLEDFAVTFTQNADGGWCLTTGTGEDAVIVNKTCISLREAGVRQIVTETSKNGVVASRTCEVYQKTPVGDLLLTKVDGCDADGNGGLTSTYEYDGSGNLVKETAPNGAVTRYDYDQWGRVLRTFTPWGAEDSTYERIVETEYEHSGAGNFNSEPSKRAVVFNSVQGQRQVLSSETYTYSTVNGIQRVECRKTAAGSTETQLTVTETHTGDNANEFARGKVRMTQAVNGVQTWHEYAATSLHGALYTATSETKVAGAFVPGQSTRTVNFIDCEGNTVRTEQFVMLNDGTWALIAGSTNTFDVQNRLIGTVHDNGRSTSQALNCQGNPLWQVDEDGVRTDYAYNSARQLIETTRSATQTTPEIITEFVRDSEGNVLTTTTHTGAMDTVSHTAYDLAGRVISETDILGRVTTTAYSSDALTTTVTLPSGATLITTTNPDGTVAREYGTGQRETLHIYDFINGLRETVKLPDGTILSQNITDGFGQTITETAPTTLANTYIYTRSVYNALGQMTRQTVGDMAPTVFEYGAMGQMTKQTVLLDATAPADATKNQITEFAYGYMSMEDGVYQVTTTTGHNAEGGDLVTVQKNLVSQLSAVLASKSISIDVRGNVTTQWTNYGAPTVRMSYVTLPTSNVTATATIIDGFTTTSTDNTGVTDTFTRAWTATGMVQTFTDGRGNTTTTRTDIAGRTICVTDAAGFTTTTEYCTFNDQPAVVTNALGKTSCYRYDIRNRKVAEFGTAIQPALFAYDDADNLIALTTFRVDDATLTTDPADRTDGDTTQWAYNAATGLEMSKTYPDNTQVLKTYDAMNRIATVTNARGIVQTRTYATATGLLTDITFSDTTTAQSFQYNVLGQLTQVTDAAGTRSFTYNQYAQPLTDSVIVGASAYPVVEAYDTFGRNTGYELKKAATAFQTVGYGYDTKGQLSTCSFLHGGEQKTFTYNRLAGTHLLERLDSPNGMSRNYTYEPHRDLISTLNDKHGTTAVVNRSYTYNALGIPTNRTIQRQGTTRQDTFTHNDRAELIAATMGTDNYAYDYDNIGNRKTAQETSNNFEYEANALNQYTQITENNTDFTPAFDLDGNQTRIKTSTGIWTATYNALNRPVRFVNEAAGIVITADYDYMGRRVFKKVETNSATTSYLRFLYRGYLQIAALDMTRSTQNAMWLITWDPTEPVATRPLALQQSGTWYTYGIDLPKNVTELYAQNGYIATAYTYSPYGLVTATGSVTQHIQWSSEYADTDLGLVYYNYRHYNQLDGRWTGRDFIRLSQVSNLYVYGSKCAISTSDCLGMFPYNEAPVSEVIDDYRQNNPNRNKQFDDLSLQVLKKGCIGYSALHLGKTAESLLESSNKCFFSLDEAKAERNLERKNGTCCKKKTVNMTKAEPRIFGFHSHISVEEYILFELLEHRDMLLNLANKMALVQLRLQEKLVQENKISQMFPVGNFDVGLLEYGDTLITAANHGEEQDSPALFTTMSLEQWQQGVRPFDLTKMSPEEVLEYFKVGYYASEIWCVTCNDDSRGAM